MQKQFTIYRKILIGWSVTSAIDDLIGKDMQFHLSIAEVHVQCIIYNYIYIQCIIYNNYIRSDRRQVNY